MGAVWVWECERCGCVKRMCENVCEDGCVRGESEVHVGCGCMRGVVGIGV